MNLKCSKLVQKFFNWADNYLSPYSPDGIVNTIYKVLTGENPLSGFFKIRSLASKQMFWSLSPFLVSHPQCPSVCIKK